VLDLFSPGMMRTPVFRIPSLLTLPNGMALAFSEARPHLHDSGVIDLVVRKSRDHGRTWSPARVAVEGKMIGAKGKATVGNPTALYDETTEVMWLLLCTNHAEDLEWQIHARAGKDTRRVWVTSSSDFGETWEKPREITSSVKRKEWTWYATGPGRGIQLQSGRLVVPCNHAEDVHEPDCPYLPHSQR
jgi:sialidase-1